ncbi:MAG TPA: hypothetical protein PKC30_12530 [Saprospiraceae bacterium]|nr:hypothetical protein [Saprospiraceae bacterium]
MITDQTIQTSRRAHVFSLGHNISDSNAIWIAAHGYGQLADRFIKKFDRINLQRHFVIAPEGLSRYYLEGKERIPVPSWMTSRFRLDEIEDFCDYLDSVYATFIKTSNAKIILFGFSQGATTLYRWIQARKPHFDYFINYAGGFPEDIQMNQVSDMLKNKHFLIIGQDDPFLTVGRKEIMCTIMQREGCTPVTIEYPGNHSIDRNILDQLVQQLNV